MPQQPNTHPEQPTCSNQAALNVEPTSKSTGPRAAQTPPTGPERTDVEQRPHWATPLVRGWLVIVAVLVFVVKQMGDMASKNELTADTFRPRNLIVLLAIFVGVFLISIGVGFFEWRTTRFRIDDTEIRINRTFITRRSDRIPFGKIQSVDVTQPFAARILGLASLTIDVGASQHKKIEYLSRRDAYRFRDRLIARSGRGAAATPGGSPTRQDAPTPANPITTAPPGQLDRHPAGTATPPTSPAPASTPREGSRPGTSPSPLGGSQWLDRRRDEDVILTVPKGRFVLSQVTSSAFLMLVLVFIISTVLTAAGGGSVLGVCFAYVLSIEGYLWTKLSKSWELTLYRSGDGLKSVHGFTSLETRTIPVQRIQGVEITQSLLWRIWGYHSVHVTVLGNNGKTESDLLPVGTGKDLDLVLDAIWPSFAVDDVSHNPIPNRARWFHWFTQRYISWGADENVITARHGLLTRRRMIVPHTRVQSTALAQGPLQRKLRLADVGIAIPEKGIGLVCPDLDAAQARELVIAEMDRSSQARRAELADPSTTAPPTIRAPRAAARAAAPRADHDVR
ncbi:PH domain-containing protein [Cutibacterium granulosum]|uniref:PH domain-containing protein n=1 Tax=Cutibacterium granulosum TaxID=33011 RepID=UPI002B238E12|nr:PH domain-containing protein [Cutibacterium granulosum]MEA5654764.1 PH domain-containing protein [Cutibacterium granulosum]